LAGERSSMQIRVLGHLEASVDDQLVAIGGAKQRAVLAMLGLEANRAVSADRLIEGLWGEEAPPTAGTCVRRPGRDTPARSPAERSRVPSGRTRCRAASTRPPARSEESVRGDAETG
jgi:hypothetical protein